MKYELEPFGGEIKTLEELAEKYHLKMVVVERGKSDAPVFYKWPDERYFASFEDVEEKGYGVLIGTYGNGATPGEAIVDYIPNDLVI